MKLSKLFRYELYFGITLLCACSLRFVVYSGPVYGYFNFFVAIGLVWFNYYVIYHDYKKKLKLDEREMLLFIQTGNIAAFVFMSFLVGIFFLQNSVITFIGEPLKEFWVFYIVPLFSLAHSLIGFIIVMIDDHRMKS